MKHKTFTIEKFKNYHFIRVLRSIRNFLCFIIFQNIMKFGNCRILGIFRIKSNKNIVKMAYESELTTS